jgi:general secretion pathway protein C
LNKTPVSSFQESGFAQTIVVSLATFTAIALLGFVLAYWTWTWFAPRSRLRTPETMMTDDATHGSLEMVYGLFGSAAQHHDSVSAVTSIKLLGIVAATAGHAGYAVMQLDEKNTLAMVEGGDVSPGIRLTLVGNDHVILEHNGTRETLTWPNKISPGGKPAMEPIALRANQ